MSNVTTRTTPRNVAHFVDDCFSKPAIVPDPVQKPETSIMGRLQMYSKKKKYAVNHYA